MSLLPPKFPSETLADSDVYKVEWYYKRYVEDFYREYVYGHFLLAAYAAVPALLTPDLLFKLWQNFNGYKWGGEAQNIHRVAVPDILLSPLCREIGLELYEMHEDIRLAFLQWLKEAGKEAIWKKRGLAEVERIAAFVERYYEIPNSAGQRWGTGYVEMQALEAKAYTRPMEVAKTLLVKMQEAATSKNGPEMLRAMDLIVKTKRKLEITTSGKGKPFEWFDKQAGLMEAWRSLIRENSDAFHRLLETQFKLLDLLSNDESGIEVEMSNDTAGKLKQLAERKVYALVVGYDGVVSKQNESGVMEDTARIFVGALRENFAESQLQLTVLLGEDATASSILSNWHTLVTTVNEDHDLLFYIAAQQTKSVDGHCEIHFSDTTTEGKLAVLRDNDLAEIALLARSASTTMILELANAGTRHWLDLKNPRNAVFAASNSEQPVGFPIFDTPKGTRLAFTNEFVINLLRWGMGLTNRQLFANVLSRCSQFKEVRPGTTFLTEPQLLCHPAAYDRFFAQGKNHTVDLQNALRAAGYLHGKSTGIWNEETAKALGAFHNKKRYAEPLLKQQYVEALKEEIAHKAEGVRPVFLIIFSDPKKKLRHLPTEAAAVLQQLDAVTNQCELLVLRNTTRKRLAEVLKKTAYRNRIELLYYSGFDDNGDFVLKDGTFTIFDLAEWLPFQQNIKLLVANTCRSAQFANHSVQLGVWAAIGVEGEVYDADAARYAERLMQLIVGGNATEESLRSAGKLYHDEIRFFKAIGTGTNNDPLWTWKQNAAPIKATASPATRKLWAVVCGVSQFQNADAMNASHCADNALRMAKFLQDYCPSLGMDVSFAELPPDGFVSRAQAVKALDLFFQAGQGDTCLFFYSGVAANTGAEQKPTMNFLFSDDSPFSTGSVLGGFQEAFSALHEKAILFILITDIHQVVTYSGKGHGLALPGSCVAIESLPPQTYTREAEGRHLMVFNNFFESFFELLTEGGALLSYKELFSRVKLRMRRRDPGDFTLDLLTSLPELADHVFLTQQPKKSSAFTVSYDPGFDAWTLNAGTRQGIRPSLSFMKTLVRLESGAVFALSEVAESFGKVGEAISGGASLEDRNATFTATLQQNALPKIQAAFHPLMDGHKKAELIEASDRHQIFFIDLITDVNVAKYIIGCQEGAYYLELANTYAPSSAQLSPKPVFDFQRDPFEFIKQMEYIAKWQGVLEMDNSNTAIARDAVEIEFETIEGVDWSSENTDSKPGIQVLNPDEVVLHYRTLNGKWSAPAIRCRMKNKSLFAFHLSVLEMGPKYDILELGQFFLEPGQETPLLFEDTQTIPFHIPREFIERGILEIYDYLKFFISEEPLEVTELTQDSLKFSSAPITRGIGTKSVQGTFVLPSSDWQAVTIPIKTIQRESSGDFRQVVEERYKSIPITVADDLQKNRWGGHASSNGYIITANVKNALIPKLYSIEATVHSTDLTAKPLTGQVAFFLHDSFSNEIEYIEAKDGTATLNIDSCYEAFTLAAYTEDGAALELDLNEVPGYPKGFYWKDNSNFQERVRKLYAGKPVRVSDDLQKNRWGGGSEANGKKLTAMVSESLVPGFFNVQMKIKFDDPKQGGEAAFFLHNSFGREIRFVPVKDAAAGLKVKAYEAFTVGAYTDDGTELELDLQEQPGYPKGFYYADPPNDDKGFYTESGISNLVRKRLKGANEYVDGQLLFYKTEQQRTWLVVTIRNVYVLLDDRDTREVGRVIQTSFERSKTLPVKIREANKNKQEMLVQFAAQDTWWYFSRNLFSKDQDLVRAVEELVMSKKTDLHNITAYVAGLSLKTPAKAFSASRKLALDKEPSKEGKEQVVISGRSIICFKREITSLAREDVLNSIILAQFAADKTYPIEKDSTLWYEEYTDVLRKLGWKVQNGNLNDFEANQNIFEMQNGVLEVLGLRFGTSGIGLINKTIAKLTQLLVEKDARVMTFGKNMQSLSKACAQVVLVTEESGRVVAECVTWFVASKNRIPKLIAGDFEGEELRISYVSGQISLSAQFYSGVRKSIQDKLNYLIADYTANIEL